MRKSFVSRARPLRAAFWVGYNAKSPRGTDENFCFPIQVNISGVLGEIMPLKF